MGKLSVKLLRIIELSSKWRSFIFILVLTVLAVLPVRIVGITHNFSICYKILGEYCYSVGITRGVSALLKGNVGLMWDYNFLAVPTLLIMIGIITYDLKKYLLKKLF